jgi:hypothetical protein
MPEFDVTVVTTRTGTHTVRVEAVDEATARGVVQAECVAGQCHSPADWCTDDVESNVLSVRHVGSAVTRVVEARDRTIAATAAAIHEQYVSKDS